MDPDIELAIKSDRLIDITTTGRKTGETHRIEIAFHYIDGEIYISGMPGTRDWYANLLANPDFIFHLKQSIQRDIPATATPVTDVEMRRSVLGTVTTKWGRQNEIEAFVAKSPLVEVKFKDQDES